MMSEMEISLSEFPTLFDMYWDLCRYDHVGNISGIITWKTHYNDFCRKTQNFALRVHIRITPQR